jgi:nicotinate-nucleotide pyrophosphorylase (carboxylating)
MLDNMSNEDIKNAGTLIRERAPNIKLEASGIMDEKRVKELSSSGLDYISSGSLTHSVKAMDLSLQFVKTEEQNNT